MNCCTRGCIVNILQICLRLIARSVFFPPSLVQSLVTSRQRSAPYAVRSLAPGFQCYVTTLAHADHFRSQFGENALERGQGAAARQDGTQAIQEAASCPSRIDLSANVLVICRLLEADAPQPPALAKFNFITWQFSLP